MPKKKTSREEIVDQAYQLFIKQGYHRTSVGEIAERCGIFKGSVFHYFNSKQELMSEVLKTAGSDFESIALSVAYQKKLTPKIRMEKVFKLIKAHYLDPEDGCIMGNIGLETVNTIPEFKKHLRTFFENWINAFEAIYSDKYKSKKAHQLAVARVKELEGAIMLCRFFDDISYIEKSIERILDELG